MRTNQESPTSQHEPRDRRNGSTSRAEGVAGDSDRRGLQLALTDALADILRWEATQAAKATKAARH